MKWLLFAVFLLVPQTPPPIPGKAANSPAGTSQGITKNTDNNKTSTAPSPSAINSVATNPNQNAPNAPKPENAPQSISVSKLPLVSVAKDWTDRAYWVFSGLLVIVGGLQAWLLWGTRSVIREQAETMARQALSMRYQTTILRDSAKAAKANAEAALLNARAVISTERPWLVISIEALGPHSNIYILRAINKGNTPAEMYEGHYECKIQPATGFMPPNDLMAPFLAPIQVLTLPGDDFEIGRIVTSSFPTSGSVYPPEALFAYGRILYWDMFTDRLQKDAKPHETQWCLTYESARNIWYRTANGYTKNT